MASSPNQSQHSQYTSSSPREQVREPTGGLFSAFQSPVPSRTSSPTQYEFIMSTGDENAESAKQKMKRVRSHVMKNYLHQQQQHQDATGETPLSRANSLQRRKSKQRSRSSRSISRESEPSPSMVRGGVSGDMGSGAFFGVLTSAESSSGNANQQRFALDFDLAGLQDEAATAARSYISSLYRDKRQACPEPTFETLNSKGEVVRIIKETLGTCGTDVPQSVILAVSLLAFGCAVDGDWDQAKGHSEALRWMVDMRGGVGTVDFELQRVLTWTVYCVSAAYCLPPYILPPLFPDVTAFSLAFLDEAQIRAWRTAKRFPKDSPFVFDIVFRLHQLGLVDSSEWYNEIDQRALSNLYFDSMHHATAFEYDRWWDANLPAGAQGRETGVMFQVWAAGLPLFMWATIRHVRTRLGFMVADNDHSPVLARIKNALENAGGQHSWPRGKQLEPVLATLVYGIEACDGSNSWRSWAMDTLRRVVELLKLKSETEFRKIVDSFPTTEEYQAWTGVLWMEVVSGASGAGTPILPSVP